MAALGFPVRVSQIARAVGVHPNTVRLYEGWGLLPPIPRTPKGYRQYSAAHLMQMRLARIALPGPFPGGGKPVYGLVKAAALLDFEAAVTFAREYARNVDREYGAAQRAYRQLEAWANRRSPPRGDRGAPLRRRAAARKLGITIDALRNWERNGLLRVARGRHGYCLYEPAALHRAVVIRSLRAAGYSVMAILRMFREYQRGNLRDLKRALNTPAQGADIVYVSDRWLTTLREHKRRARKILRHIAVMQSAP